MFGFDPFSASPFSAVSSGTGPIDAVIQESANAADTLDTLLDAQAALAETATGSDTTQGTNPKIISNFFQI